MLDTTTTSLEPTDALDALESLESVDKAPGPTWLQGIERTVTGLGYELVAVERAARGLLRVTIDRVPGRAYPAQELDGSAADHGEFITVQDCERVTRQLQYALEVDGLPYERLEVSSPGLDRLLKHAGDFERFAGQAVAVTLKQPFQGRKHWKGVLHRPLPQVPEAWRLELDHGIGGRDGRARPRPASNGTAKRAAADAARAQGALALDFRLDEVREARLVPVVDFKGRGRQDAAAGKGKGKGGATGVPSDGGLER